MASVQVQVLVDGKPVAGVITNATEFSTGSRGYRAQGQVAIDGKVHSVGCNLIEFGSKPKKK